MATSLKSQLEQKIQQVSARIDAQPIRSPLRFKVAALEELRDLQFRLNNLEHSLTIIQVLNNSYLKSLIESLEDIGDSQDSVLLSIKAGLIKELADNGFTYITEEN